MILNKLSLVATCFIFIVNAQDLSVLKSWRKFSNSRSLSERISISQRAINAILPQLNISNAQFNGIGYWQSGNVFSAMANHDYFAKTTTNKKIVLNNLNKAFSLYTNYDQNEVSASKFACRYAHLTSSATYNDDAMWWATAALYAYRVYGDGAALSHAKATWNRVNRFVITTSDVASGSHPGKNFTVSGKCAGKTMAGGVFWRPTQDNADVNSITTGLFITLSAYLAEITGVSKYKNAAIFSAKWIEAHNVANNIVLDTVNAHNCSTSPASWIFTYNSGKYIERLGVLAKVTGDSHWKTLMTNIIATAVKSSAWQGSDGIIKEGAYIDSNNDAVGFKAVFIRGLTEAFLRNPSYTDLRVLIRSYTNIQYNALLDLAATGDTYSANWHGPPHAFTTWGQFASLDVFVSAIIAN